MDISSFINRADAPALSKLALLPDGTTSKVIYTENFTAEVRNAISRGYHIIGESNFNGKKEGPDGAIEQAKAIKAKHILIVNKFAESQTITAPLILPTTSTTYNSGTVSSGYRSANCSGTSTTYCSAVTPITSTVDRYDQIAVYFAKSLVKPRIGVFLEDMTPALRSEI